MKISIIIPVYNVEKYIRQCIDSVLDQTFKDFELILVDDGSTDNSGEILDEYGKKDSRVIAIHKKNEGCPAARNDGLKAGQGDYIYLMDSDDYLEPDTLEAMYESAVKNDADVVIADHYEFKQDGQQKVVRLFSKEFVTDDPKIISDLQNTVLYYCYSPYFTPESKGLGLAAPWTKLVRSELILNNNLLFDPDVKGIFDDGLFALNVFEYAKKVTYIQKLTYHYRILPGSLIHRYNKNRIQINEIIFKKIRDFQSRNNKNEDFKNAYYARVVLYLSNLCNVYFLNKEYEGSPQKSLREFFKTVKSEPYHEAIRNVDLSKLSRIHKIFVLLSWLHLNPLIWLIYKFKNFSD